MNIEQFSKLKVGDKIENRMNPGSVGEVVAAEPNGVRLVWGERYERETRFFYSAQTTAWMHWSMVGET